MQAGWYSRPAAGQQSAGWCSERVAGGSWAGLLRQNMHGSGALRGKETACGSLDICGGDGIQAVKVAIQQAPGQADGFQHADAAGLSGDGVAGIDLAGNQLGTYALQFGSIRRGFLQGLQLLPEGLLYLVKGDAFLNVGGSRQHEQAVAPGKGVEPAGSSGDQLLLALQPSWQTGAFAATKQGADQAQSVNFGDIVRGVQGGYVKAQHQHWQAGFQVLSAAPLARLVQLQRQACFRNRPGRDVAKVAFDQSFDIIRFYIPHNNQGGIAGAVPAVMPLAQICYGHAFKVVHPADGGNAVAAGRMGQGQKALVGQSGRVVIGTHAALFLDDFDFPQKLIFGQGQASEPVGFHFQRNFQPVFGQHLVVGRVVVTGKGVFFCTQLAQNA